MGSPHLPNLDKALCALKTRRYHCRHYLSRTCTVTFTSDHIIINDNGSTIIEDNKLATMYTKCRNTCTPAPTKSSKDGDFVNFIHASFGSPAFSTFTDAIRANYLPFLTRLRCTVLATNTDCAWQLRPSKTGAGHHKKIRFITSRYGRCLTRQHTVGT